MNRYKYIDDIKEAQTLGLATPRQRKAHIHTLDLKPLIGASTAKGIVGGKDALMQWYADMAAVAGLAFPAQDIKAEYEVAQAISDKIAKQKAKQELDKKYPNFAEARRAAVTHRDEKAEEGTERHGTLEDYIKLCLANGGKPVGVSANDYPKEICDFINWALDHVDVFYFTEAYGYNEPLWVGGIADLGMKLKDGRRVVGDHKSAKEAYPDMFLQTALYDLLLAHSGILDKDGNKKGEWLLADGYVIFPFRSDPFTPEFRWNADEYRTGAKNVVQLYKLLELP